ncbi:hypothetical protein KI387_023371, partial [Taxus chinensis]
SSESQETKITIEYNGVKNNIFQCEITEALNASIDEIAGAWKGISDTPITLNSELNALHKNFSNLVESIIEFMRLMDSIKGMLHKLIIQEDIELFPDDPDMHCIMCLTRMFKAYMHDLFAATNVLSMNNFLVKEINL